MQDFGHTAKHKKPTAGCMSNDREWSMSHSFLLKSDMTKELQEIWGDLSSN